jgi:hypothetical protein
MARRMTGYGVSGLFAGSAAVCLAILLTGTVENWDSARPMHAFGLFDVILWNALAPHLCMSPVVGMAAGYASSTAPARWRRPLALGSVWASLLGTTTLLVAALRENSPETVVVNTAIGLVVGFAYGGMLGFIGYWMRYVLRKGA